jgi:hypothetical protein
MQPAAPGVGETSTSAFSTGTEPGASAPGALSHHPYGLCTPRRVFARRLLHLISPSGVVGAEQAAPFEQGMTPAFETPVAPPSNLFRPLAQTAHAQKKGTPVTKASHALAALRTPTGVAGSAYVDACSRTAASSAHALLRAPFSALALFLSFAFVALGLTASSALATTAHIYVGQFGSAGTGAGQFTPGGPTALTIEQSSGEVFAVDAFRPVAGVNAPRIERFNAAGDFQSAFNIDASVEIVPTAIAIDPAGSGSLYVGGFDNVTQATGKVLKYSAAGAFEYALSSEGTATTFGYGSLLAVDPADGTLYLNAVSEATGLPVIDAFDDTGKFLATFDGSTNSPDGAFGAISALAVDSSHRLYVTDAAKARTDRYSASGEWQATVDDGSRGAPGAIVADPTSSELYILEAGPLGQQITSFSAGGAAPLESFGAGHLTGAAGIAVTHSSGSLYTSDAGITAIERFVSFIAPSVTTEGASGIEATGATLTGTINPEGVAGATTYRFDWGLDSNYGNSTPEIDTGGGSADVPASAPITGLTPGTTYHYHLIGTNDSGSSAGADETFTTAPGQVTVDTQGPPYASAMTPNSATLNDVVNPNGADTKYHFEYGTDMSYGSSTADADAGSAPGEVAAPAPATGLQPSTTYHFRVVADNGVDGAVTGADATFTTGPATPATASNITATEAQLHGTINPQGSSARYFFEYGTTSAYGSSTPQVALGSGSADVPVSATTGLLTPGTSYHFRVVETISTGQTVSSNDATFTTIAAAAVTTKAVTSVTPSTATLNASIDTHGNAGSYSFAVTSPDSAYAVTTASAALSASSGSQSVSVALTDLPPGAHYVVRASATVAGATTWGDRAVFETPGLPPFNPPAPPPSISGAPYGCAAPHINPVNAHPKAGDSVTVTGSDLGVGGSIALGSSQLQPSSWTASSISFQVPEGTSGTQPLTINCGALSNVVGVAILRRPSNAFTISKTSVKGSTASLSVSVPGPGKLQSTSAKTPATSQTLSRASSAQLSLHLSKAAKKSLAKAHSKKLTVTLRVSFTPAGGTSASRTLNITFKRGGTR